MNQILQVRNQTIKPEQVIPLLTDYQMLPQFLRQVITDQAIADCPCDLEERAAACQELFQAKHLNTEAEQQAWLKSHDITAEQLEVLATRRARIEKFKRTMWEKKLPSYFLQRKWELDRVIYSIIRTVDAHIAQELYFRIQEGEQTFAELAQQYSQGPEAKVGGVVGPIEWGKLPPLLVRELRSHQPGKLLPPMILGEWVAIIRIEQHIPAQLDKQMRQRLLDDLFETWLQQELVQLASNGSIALNVVETDLSQPQLL